MIVSDALTTGEGNDDTREEMSNVVVDDADENLSRGGEVVDRRQDESEEKAIMTPKYRIRLEWIDIVLEVDQVIRKGGKLGRVSSVKRRTLLNHLSGVVNPGEFWAIMGPSGCGKTTLLNVLSGRRETGVIGQVLVNGKPRDKNWKRQIAYVLQDDVLFPTFTVYQTLLFQATIRLGNSISAEEKERKVEQLIALLRLTKARNTLIGNQFIRGVSGGERKRVNVGVQLLTESGVLFLDEPTSGLDATSAFHIVNVLRQLSTEGYAIIMTIHQPSIDIFEQFDKLLLLLDGYLIYSGDAASSYDYFASINMKCPVTRNPADFIMEAFMMNSLPSNAKESSVREYLTNQWQARNSTPPAATEQNAVLGQDGQALVGFTKFPPGYSNIFFALARRSLQMNAGSYFQPLPIVQTIFIAVIYGLVWLQTPHTPDNFRNRTGAIFFLILFAGGFNPLINVLYSFPAEQPVILRERSEGSYPLSAYFLAKIISEAPFEQIYPLGFLLISYWMVGFNPRFTNFLLFWVILMFVAWASSGLGLAISSIVYNARTATTLATIVLLLMILTSGFYVAFRSIKTWISWLGYLSYIKYAYDGMILVEIGADNAIAQSTTTDFFVTNYGAVLGILLGYIIFFRILSFIFLKLFFKAKT